MPNKLQEVREAIIKAVPEIMKLEFGCEVIDFQKKRIFVSVTEEVKYTNGTKGNFCINLLDDSEGIPRLITRCNQDRSDVEALILIGRPIRLSDILFVGKDAFWAKDVLNIITDWNLLKDDLSLQDENTINFLHEILCKTN